MQIGKRLCAFHVAITAEPLSPRFGVFYPPTETTYYRDARVTRVAVVSDTEQHVWDVGLSANKDNATSTDFCGVWNQMLIELMEVLERYDTLVGHYIVRDMHVFTAELYRRKLNTSAAAFFNKPYECVMYNAVLVKHLAFRKYPELLELYRALFPREARDCTTEVSDTLERCKMIFDCYSEMNALGYERKFHPTVLEWARKRGGSVWHTFLSTIIAPMGRVLRRPA